MSVRLEIIGSVWWALRARERAAPAVRIPLRSHKRRRRRRCVVVVCRRGRVVLSILPCAWDYWSVWRDGGGGVPWRDNRVVVDRDRLGRRDRRGVPLRCGISKHEEYLND